ncbi:unnamed protein product [Staurois parvus]|uniref:Uncharacterized protein n=1 Tax=Staurois parvus TaxID=386267 RepID=A0ABN9A9H5_9NEOB|nr:unnamed protein product [Staurois parvus]
MALLSSGTCHVSQKTTGREGRRTTSASDRLGDHSGNGSGYQSILDTRSPKVPILNGEQGTSL